MFEGLFPFIDGLLGTQLTLNLLYRQVDAAYDHAIPAINGQHDPYAVGVKEWAASMQPIVQAALAKTTGPDQVIIDFGSDMHRTTMPNEVIVRKGGIFAGMFPLALAHVYERSGFSADLSWELARDNNSHERAHEREIAGRGYEPDGLGFGLVKYDWQSGPKVLPTCFALNSAPQVSLTDLVGIANIKGASGVDLAVVNLLPKE